MPELSRGRHAGGGRRRARVRQAWWRRRLRERGRTVRAIRVPGDTLLSAVETTPALVCSPA
jgi:hypothetical protein